MEPTLLFIPTVESSKDGVKNANKKGEKVTTVWIVNKSSHDYSPALLFGDLAFLSEGPMDKFAVNDMERQFTARLANSAPDDYIVLTALSVMNALACTCFALKHGRLNLLIYKDREYVERRLVFEKENL